MNEFENSLKQQQQQQQQLESYIPWLEGPGFYGRAVEHLSRLNSGDKP